MKKWNEEEIQILKKAVSDSADNLKLAFQAASELTGRTPSACASYWYNRLRRQSGYAFMSYARNSVGAHTSKQTEKKPSLWTRFIHLFQ